MNAPIEDALRASVTDLTLDTPAAVVLRRGDDLRRRRRARLTGATGITAVAAITAVSVLGNQSSGPDPVGPMAPDTASIQVASWSGGTTNLSADLLADAQAACAASAEEAVRRQPALTEPGWGLFDTTAPIAAETRDDVVLTYFRQGSDYATCTLELGDDGRVQAAAQVVGVQKALPDGRDLEVVTLGAADPGVMGGTLADIYAVLRTSSDVARVEVEVAGETSVSSAQDLAFFWLEDDVLTDDDLARATVTAFDADGAVLDRLAPGELW